MKRAVKSVFTLCIVPFFAILGAGMAESATAPLAETGIPALDCVIEPSEVVDVGSPVPGVIATMPVDRSDLVTKGTVIAKLESGVELASVEMSRKRAELTTGIELRRANAEYNRRKQIRNRELFEKAVISKNDMDLSKTEARIAYLQVREEKENQLIAGLELARTMEVLQQRTIRSPVDGVVMERFKSVGAYVKDTPVMRIAQLDPLYVEVILPVKFLGRVRPGMRAEVASEIPGQRQQVATVTRVDRVADAASGTFGARLNLPNPDYRIAGGVRCRLSFLPEEKSDAPEPAVAKAPEQPLQKVDDIDHQAVVLQVESIRNRRSQVKAMVSVEHPEQAASEPIKAPPVCYAIGPFRNAAAAQGVIERLAGKADDLQLREKANGPADEFMVLALPEKDAKATGHLIDRLRKAGITDLYKFRRGRYRGQVSLGLYRNRSRANYWRNQLTHMGFQVEVVERRKRRSDYWLDLVIAAGEPDHDSLREIVAEISTRAHIDPMDCRPQVAGLEAAHSAH